MLLRVHDLVLDRQSELLDLVQLESGKARSHAYEEVADCAIVARHYARRGPSLLRETKHVGVLPVLSRAVEHHRPKGVVGIVSPWNYPLSLAVTDAIPALLAGNAVVLRPDLQGSLTALAAAEIFEDAGLPEDLLQVVLGHGEPTGQAVVDRADYVSFTGSTATGRRVAQADRQAAGRGQPRARRQEHHVRRRRRRPAPGRRGCRARLLLLGRPALHQRRAARRARRRLRRVRAAVRRAGLADAPVDRPALGRRHGQPGQRGAEGRRCSATSTTPSSKGARVLTGGHEPPRHRAARRRADRARGRDLGDGLPRRGDLRAGRLALPGRLRRRGRAAGQRHRVRPQRLGVDARRAPRPRRSRPASTPARSTSTRATPRPGAASPPRWAG